LQRKTEEADGLNRKVSNWTEEAERLVAHQHSRSRPCERASSYTRNLPQDCLSTSWIFKLYLVSFCGGGVWVLATLPDHTAACVCLVSEPFI
jgi:hypothetical protein